MLFVMFSFSCTVFVFFVLGVFVFSVYLCLFSWGDDYFLLYVLRSVFVVSFLFLVSAVLF